MTRPKQNSNDDAYARIAEIIDWERPMQHVGELRRLALDGHKESMTLLAVILGDIDSHAHRNEIIELNEKAFESGSVVAADNMAIQYKQWNESFLSKIWRSRASQAPNGTDDGKP